MMKTYLKRAFQLSDSGVKGLAKSIWSFFLYYVSFVPPMICVFLFADRLLNGNTGKPVVYLLFMLAATLVMYLVINYNYKTTYDETYQESANLRIDLAEQLSKLPLSYFSKHNLSDLAQTIMADVASIEHAFANAVANSIGFAIYFLVISVALLIMNWKLGLCVLLPVLTSASVLFLTKKLQVRDVNKHYDKLRDISESFQNAIELNQEIKSYGLKEKVEAQMDQQLDESENLQWKAQIIQTIPVTIGQTLSILPIGITATVGLSMLASGQVSILILPTVPFWTQQTVFIITYQIHTSRFLKRFQHDIIILRIAILDQSTLHRLFVRILRNIHRFHRPWIHTCIIHTGRNR